MSSCGLLRHGNEEWEGVTFSSKDIENIEDSPVRRSEPHESSDEIIDDTGWLTRGMRNEIKLPETDEDRGIGDVLYGLDPDPDSDPVETVKSLWNH